MKPNPLKIYNSLTRKKEVFRPSGKTVTMYTCGPTVYGPGHLGHARTYVGFDLLKRIFLKNGFGVNHIMNITDVHDSVIEKAKETGKTIFEIADEYTPFFYEELRLLNTLPADFYPEVTEHIPQIISAVGKLIEKGFAYETEDGVYFDLSKFPSYGKLSRIKRGKGKTGTRIAADKYERKEVSDFALWKKSAPDEPAWRSPWGVGRPGWHIECSVLAKEHLGATLDIHAGARDLLFPHHENEIAQSEALNGVPFSRFWIHFGLLKVEGKKMSKSLGNYIEFREILDKKYTPLAFRYLCLTAHYRDNLNFTWKALSDSSRALERLLSEISTWDPPAIGCAEYEQNFIESVNNDLNLPKALALAWKLVKDQTFPTSAKHQTLLFMDEVLGLGIAKTEHLKIPVEVKKMVRERERLRGEGIWEEADEVREKVERWGYEIEDTPQGPKIKRLIP